MRNLLAMTKKRTPKKNLPVEPIQLPPEPLTPLENLLNDFIKMKEICELAAAGFSMSSIAASVEISVTTFTSWVKKGKSLEESEPNCPEVILWKALAKHWATAKGLAEAKLAQTKPEFFLTRGPARLLGDDWSDEQEGSAIKQKETLDVTGDFLTALRRLRESGHDLNEIIDANSLTMKVEYVDKPVDLLTKHGITEERPIGLPTPLAKQTLQLDTLLNIERQTIDVQEQPKPIN